MKYIELEKEAELATIWINDPDEKMNVLKPALLEEYAEALATVKQDSSVKALVIASRKPNCFVAGADIDMFQNYPESAEAMANAARGHEMLKELANLPIPTVAALRGVALGGGLELAMACQYRIAANDSKTMFGLPEVKLGLLPGLGGTQRLPRLVGLQASLDMLLTGKNVYPRKAKKMGLVDKITHGPGLVEAAKTFAREMAANPKTFRRKTSLVENILEGPLKGVVYNMAAKTVEKQTAGNYPAPKKILECVRVGLSQGMEQGIKTEIANFDQLVRSPESKALVSLFFGMNDSKKNPNSELVRPVKRLGVLGAGLMGAGVAEISAQKGYPTVLKDISAEALGRGEKAIWDSYSKRVKRKIMSSFERDQIFANVMGTTRDEDLAGCDVVIEAVFEDLKLKQKILADVEKHAPEHCIFATNTSSIPISQIAATAKRPEQVIGMHYFSPVPKMPLLEIIVTDQTADWVIATAVEVGIKQGKNIIVVKDGPGFYTTRILGPMLNEAVLILEEGGDVAAIDKAMFKFGFPVGPVTLIDEVGIDVGAHVGETFEAMVDERGMKPALTLKKLYEAGYLGRKNKKGFYRYDGKKKKKKEVNTEIYSFFGGHQRKSFADEEIQERLSLMMLNEAAYCLQEGILDNPKDGDLGAILGLGFPPFRGGPFRHMDSVGVEKILELFKKWEDRCGARFKPAQILLDKNGQTFHS